MKKYFFLFIYAVSSNIALAGSMGSVEHWSKVATLSLGSAYTNPGLSQSIFVQPDFELRYIADNNTDVLFSGELFLGVQRPINALLLGQIGLAFAGDSPAQLSGETWVDANEDYNNYTYQYRIQHEHLAMKGKLLPNADMFITPYLSGSLGVGFNRSYSFNLTPIIIQEIPTPLFQSHTAFGFTYTLGAGFQKALNEHWRAGVGYEFADWGKSSLGRARGQTINEGCELTNLHTNGLQFSITYLSGR
ncbi:MAG: outer membrane beta-barrel protein [Legionellaceae bacterium]|nr:outer membrane beta-barrel protein [Legionellaceae bacterium]